MKILLINNHSLLNVGDYAILLETLHMLHDSIPGVEIELVFNDISSARSVLYDYDIYAAPLTWAAPLGADGKYHFKPAWQRLLYLALLILGGLLYRLTNLMLPVFIDRRKRALLYAFSRADLVLACGGGYIYAPGAGDGLSGWFGFMISGCALALLMGKPLALLPQSIGPLHDSFQRCATRWVVRHARLVCVRERQSLAILSRLGADKRALLLPDMAFGAQTVAVASTQVPFQHISGIPNDAAFVVGITALNWSGQSFTFQGQEGYEVALLGVIDTITAQGGAVVLFAQCCGPSAAEDDRIIGRALHAHTAHPERVLLVEELLPPDTLQSAYGTVDYFIGTRMHSVILALNAGTPVLAIGYLHKTRGVLDALMLGDSCLDIGSISATQLISALERLRASPEQPGVAPYLERSRRLKRALGQLLLSIR